MNPDTTKYKQIIFGAEATPLPVWDPQEGTTGALASPLSGITLHTQRKDKPGAPPLSESLYADLMRNLPSRSMLPHLIHELTERDPNRVDWDKHSFLCGYIGPPSIGKSFMIKTLGKLTHSKGCLYLNCKDIDMGSIFCETVFDTSAANREKAAIDAKILQGNQGGKGLSQDSQTMLRNALGEAYIEDKRDGKTLVSIDWTGIRVKGDTPEEQNYQKQVLREAISQVCQNEGISMTADMGQIGISTRDGIAIRAADPRSADYGRPVLLDELNRSKPGTLQKLYEFFAMLSDPKVEQFQVVGGENRPFTFRRDELPVSYRMNFTGNPSGRAMGSADMDRPLISRFGTELDIRTVPDPALHDYADRIAQNLTGVPLTQIYYSARPFFDSHPGQLAETAKTYRLKGLSEEAKRDVPAEELLNIAQAERTLQVSEQLAEFFASLKHVFNPESQIYRGSGLSLSQEYESYLQGVEIDLRLVTKLLEKASVVTPRVLQPDVVDYAAAFSAASGKAVVAPVETDDRLADRGRRLETYLQSWMHQVLVPADAQSRGIRPEECQKVLKIARTLAAHCGIGEMKLKESPRGGIKRIGELFDYDRLANPDEQGKLMRDLLVEAVRERYAERQKQDPKLPALPEKNDDILTVAEMRQAVETAAALKTRGVFTAALDAADVKKSPFAQVHAADDAVPPTGLTGKNEFLAALAVPALREKTVAGLWDKKLLKLPYVEPSDEAVKIAANDSATGLAVTTVMVENKGKPEALHIFRAAPEGDKPESFVVVASGIDKRLQALLRSGGVNYVDFQDIGAARAVNAAIDDRVSDKPTQEKIRRSLSAAFLLRNGTAGEEAGHLAKSPGELMVSAQSLPPEAPVHLTNGPEIKASGAIRPPAAHRRHGRGR
jgi:hypothetical protein